MSTDWRPTTWRPPDTGDKRLRVRFRNGAQSKHSYRASQLNWSNRNYDFDIIAWQPQESEGMNATTVIEHEPNVSTIVTLEKWASDMRRLIADKRNVEWQIADALDFGQANFGEDPQMRLFLEAIGYDSKRAVSDAKVARLIPPSWRTDKVSFEVCKQIAKIEDEVVRQRMIKQAVDEHWKAKDAHHAVVGHKVETGQLFEDEDATSRFATEFFRLWNRMPVEAREYAFPLLEISAASGFGPIDEDAAI